MVHFHSIIHLFPRKMRECLRSEIQAMGAMPEEIRLKIGAPVCLRSYGQERFCCEPLSKEQLLWVVGNAADGSYHTAARYLQMGYIPLRYGSRMGVCGNGINGEIASFGDITSACIRVARSADGCSDELFNELYKTEFRNTIIIAPPGTGKTTLLRELIRKLSYGGQYIGVADERGEIAGMYRDKPSFDLGPRSDILSGIPKGRGALMLLRSMTPDILAMDEITAQADSEAIVEAAGCGAGLLTTIHGDDISVLLKPTFRYINEMGLFYYGVLIHVQGGKRMYKAVNLNDETVWCNNHYGHGIHTGVLALNGDERAHSCT